MAQCQTDLPDIQISMRSNAVVDGVFFLIREVLLVDGLVDSSSYHIDNDINPHLRPGNQEREAKATYVINHSRC